MRKIYPLLALAIVISSCSEGVKKQALDPIERLEKDIVYLASDELEGREAGTPGEAKAAAYIISRFEELGLSPAGVGGSYRQAFEFKGSPALGEDDFFSIEGEEIPSDDYHPLNFSGSASVEGQVVDIGFGIHAPDLAYDDYAEKAVNGKIVLFRVSSPDGIHPHSAYLAYHDLRLRAETAEAFGATGIVLIREDGTTEDPSDRLTENVNPIGIPVLFYHGDIEISDGTEVSFQQTITREIREATNLLALLDKGKPSTFVIGAHYDHLGYGDSGSLHRGERAIHNGADDNASGVAAMLLLAERLNDDPLEHNVLFMAFSGEEKGLLGSNYFVKNPCYDLEKVDYMLNMDMVGRLDSSERTLSINGVGTSPSWGFIDSLMVSGLKPVTTKGGTGSSDHMSFYLNDIPVLHFFSGTHGDYHKPSDDEELINYEGILDIVEYMEVIIQEVDDDGELTFQQTQDEGRKAAAFKVTLGVVPDYLYEDRGMRIDGVTEGRPGDVGGMQRGDIIVGMGERKVDDIYAYMEALASFQSGDSVIVTVIRDGEEVPLNVRFD